jgi:hypothetical protein
VIQSNLQTAARQAGSLCGLHAEAAAFVARYHANSALLADQNGWDVSIALQATDTGEAVWLRVADGVVVEIRAIVSPSSVPAADIVVSAERSMLSDILGLRRLPSEPYLFGELLVRGPEPDFLRIDYIVSALSGGR